MKKFSASKQAGFPADKVLMHFQFQSGFVRSTPLVSSPPMRTLVKPDPNWLEEGDWSIMDTMNYLGIGSNFFSLHV